MRLVGLAVVLALSLALAPLVAQAQQATPSGALNFENADIQIVIKHVGRLTGITFLFDPEQVKGKITLLSPKSVSLVAHEAMTVKVVPLTYARAGELAYTLSWVAPRWVRIVPYYPTNSLVISAPPEAVEELIDIIKPSTRD